MLHFLLPKRPSFDIGLSLGGDMHAHWIPNVDDGASNIEAGLAMVERYVDMGFSKLCATPHIYPELYPNTPQKIEVAYAPIASVITTRFPQLKICFAAEYYINADFNSLITQADLLCFDTDKVLIEQGFISESPHLKETLFLMQIHGYQPVLAHPERYAYYYASEQRLHFFQDAHIKLQLNLLSLAGKYGKAVTQVAERWLLRLRWYRCS